MKKLLTIVALGLTFAMLGIFCIAWYAGYKMSKESVYAIEYDSEVIASVQNTVFVAYYPCLSYIDGNLYHGQDTFEVVKFHIETSHSSWRDLLKKVQEPDGDILPTAALAKNLNVSLPSTIEPLATDEESLLYAATFNQTEVYITACDVGGLFLYLVGDLVPAGKVTLTIRE